MSEGSGETPPEDRPGPSLPPPPPAQPQWNPQSGFPAGDPRALPAYPSTNPYAAQQPYRPGQPGMPYPAFVLPDHPKATAALVVGLVSVAGMFVLILPVLASPVAWVLGVQARRQIRREPQRWGGESKATAGMVLGIIGTFFLLLVILVVVIVVIVAVNDPGGFDSDTAV
jgi:hypothetical protein